MEIFPKKTVLDTIEAGEEHAALLSNLLEAVNSAESQVEESAEHAMRLVETTFSQLESALTSYLDARKTTLLDTLSCFRCESLVPLNLCKQQIISRREASYSLVKDATNVLNVGGFKSQKMYSEFMLKSAALGALPAVPDMELVPNITFHCSLETFTGNLETQIMSFGNVSKIGPIQIISIEAHPGSLLIRWEEIDVESLAEVQSYKLQMAVGISPDEQQFCDLYEGNEMMYLARSLQHHEMYSFRVSCRMSVDAEWSAWSRIQTACARLQPFTWDPTNSDYFIANDKKLAKVIRPGSFLYSAESFVSNGHFIKFSIFNAESAQPEEGVALCTHKHNIGPGPTQVGMLFVSFLGEIYIDGEKKRINLPKMASREYVILSCDFVNNKWRISIESGGKAVTYDWASACDHRHLYFGVRLCHPERRVLVE